MVLENAISTPFLTPFLQSWWALVSRTEALSQVLRRHSEALAAGPLAKLSLLIRDKQQLRKAFSEQWHQLSQEYSRVCWSQQGNKGMSWARSLTVSLSRRRSRRWRS